MSYTAIERKIDYNMAGPDKAVLFEPISVKGNPTFSLQFYFKAIAGAPLDGEIHLKISNKDVDVAPPDADFTDVANNFPFTYGIIIDAAGDQTYYIFVGTAQGVGNCIWVTASFVKNGISGGRIEKAILVGQLGNQ